MAITFKPQDKFAFLYSGKADDVYQNNLKEVFTLLTDYLNYPAANVKLYVGGTINAAILDPLYAVEVPTSSDAKSRFFDFATQVCANNPGSVTINTVLYYFTGGSVDPIDPSGTYNEMHPRFIFLNDDSSFVPNDFKKILMGFDPAAPTDPLLRKNYFTNSYVHIFFDMDKAGGFDEFIDSLGITSGTETFSCASAESSAIDLLLDTSEFTYHWCRAFKMFPFTPAGTNFADKLTPGVSPDIESGTNELVSLHKATDYGMLTVSASQTASCIHIGVIEPHYLGLPYLVIRDGSPNLWQSPDIRLYHCNPVSPHDELPDVAGDYIDDYATDASVGSPDFYYKNHIHVNVWNYGTHPVVHFKTNVILYDTGCSGSGTPGAMKDVDLRSGAEKYSMIPVESGAFPIVSENDIDNIHFHLVTGMELNFDNILFPFNTHRCIRAKTALGTDANFDVLLDPWDFDHIDTEAQRNINVGAISSSTGGGGGSGSGGGGGGKKDLIDLKGKFRKKFIVENPFRKKKKFRIINPYIPELDDIFEVTILRLGEKVRKIASLRLGQRNYFDLWLEPGEKAEFMVEIRNRINIKAFEHVEFNFEILVAEKTSDPFVLNRSFLKMPGFVTIAGFTIALDVFDANLIMQIKDEKGNPAAITKVVIESADGLHRAELKTDKNGILRLEGINPAKYKIEIVGATGKSPKPLFADLKRNPDNLMRIVVKKSLLG